MVEKVTMGFHRKLLNEEENGITFNSSFNSSEDMFGNMENSTTIDNNTEINFHDDLFNLLELRNGAILLHIIGMVYMIGGYSILFQQYLIPCLFAIVKRFSCSEDVAGAMVVAIGLLLPDLIQTIISVFVSFPIVLFGKLVGGISFNLLIYLGVAGCVGKNLQLSGLTIGRDFIFQFLLIVILVVFMIDGLFLSYELILLFLFYGIYCLLLKFNGRINQFFKNKCCSKESSKSGEIPMDDNNPANPESFSNEVVATNIQSFTDSILNESPLSLKLSDNNNTSEKIVFVIWFPLIAISWLLMNWFDVRKPGKMNYFIINYILVNVLMRLLAYLVVWWGTVAGIVLGKAIKSSGPLY